MIKQIFSINPGRCGSHYLYSLFKCAEGVAASHEMEPKMQGEAMAQWNAGDGTLTREEVKVRLEQIVRAQNQGKVWFSSNNAFIKGYGHVLMEYIRQEETGVVVLFRDPERIAKSIVTNGWTVAGEKSNPDKSNVWLLWPGMERNLTEGPVVPDPLELASWYVNEVYARAHQFALMFPRIHYYSVWVDQINSIEKCRELFSFFGLKPTAELENIVGKPTNCGKET